MIIAPPALRLDVVSQAPLLQQQCIACYWAREARRAAVDRRALDAAACGYVWEVVPTLRDTRVAPGGWAERRTFPTARFEALQRAILLPR